MTTEDKGIDTYVLVGKMEEIEKNFTELMHDLLKMESLGSKIYPDPNEEDLDEQNQSTVKEREDRRAKIDDFRQRIKSRVKGEHIMVDVSSVKAYAEAKCQELEENPITGFHVAFLDNIITMGIRVISFLTYLANFINETDQILIELRDKDHNTVRFSFSEICDEAIVLREQISARLFFPDYNLSTEAIRLK